MWGIIKIEQGIERGNRQKNEGHQKLEGIVENEGLVD